MPDPAPSALRPSVTPATSVAGLATAVGARLIGADTAVHGVEQRSNAVRPGDLFAALPGSRAHGATFATAAVEAGAVALLTDDAGLAIAGELGVPVLLHSDPRAVLGEISATVYGHPSRHIQVIGVTGTSGKTTTSYLIEAGLEAAGRKPGLIGTIEIRIHGRRIPSALTTPEAPQLHALFAAMLEQGVDCVVMEVSSHALALGRVDGTHFDVGAFTNLSQDHLDFHPTLDDYFAAKARLFDPASPVHAAHSVICIDDEWGARMADLAAPPVVTVATTRAADWTAGDLAARDDGGQEFVIRHGTDVIAARLGLPGPYNVANALLAVATCASAGVDAVTAAGALAEVAVPGRVQRIDRGQPFLAIVDYAHKPAALDAVIATLRAHAKGRIGVVVGAGGDRDTGKRILMGEVGARAADLLVVTDDNPRSEDPAVIRAALLAGADAVPDDGRAEVREIGDRAAAIEAAVRWARPGDVVLVAGKGHETGQETAGVKHPFDDREVLARALESDRGERSDGETGRGERSDGEIGRGERSDGKSGAGS